ncbi:MAG: LPXTG cell wall anchor domain-containing protein, partial [Clostridiales bacterium]|nr:LPXTG cell wall anchor domain-containing protein [Clostridiales bacterium]
PSGYTKAADITFEVVANYQTSSDNPLLNTLQVNITQGSTSVVGNAASSNVQSGIIEMGIINSSGNKLPSTGGIGTTLFYIVGGVMVAGAVVLLITRKRMGENE